MQRWHCKKVQNSQGPKARREWQTTVVSGYWPQCPGTPVSSGTGKQTFNGLQKEIMGPVMLEDWKWESCIKPTLWEVWSPVEAVSKERPLTDEGRKCGSSFAMIWIWREKNMFSLEICYHKSSIERGWKFEFILSDDPKSPKLKGNIRDWKHHWGAYKGLVCVESSLVNPNILFPYIQP